MYKISIIIPVFNVKDYLQNAFDSILNQSFGFDKLEVIFVDDCSNDGSSEIIDGFSNCYNNVKSIHLKENSGFAGKPRNVGIENASADYLMFLDPDDIFSENACEILYNSITRDDLDLVSGNYDIHRNSKVVRNNWNLLNLKDGEFHKINKIDENPKFLMTVPSVWAKIFKKKFILDNNIIFPVGVPGQDLVFVSHALLNANGIMFINKPIIEYIPREKGKNKSVTSKKTKKVLSGFIRSYTILYWIFNEYNEEYCWLASRNLFFWMKQLVLSDLSISDKVDLLHASNFLFEKFIESDKLKTPNGMDEFLDLIHNKDYLNAARLSEKLVINYLSDEEIIGLIKNKTIFSLFYGMDLNIGGLAKAVFNRDNVISEHGYDVKLLNIDELKNFEYVISYFKDIGFLNKSIDFINIFDYYSEKNTFGKLFNKSLFLNKFPMGFSVHEGYLVEKTETHDKSIILNYFDKNLLESDENDLNDIDSLDVPDNMLIKSEVYLGNCLRIIKTYLNGKLSCEKFFTKDYYNYLSIKYDGYDKFVTLYDRQMNLNLTFDNLFKFYDYFYNDVLIKYEENKPFLINECSGPVPDFDNVDSKLAYKIANIHTNPYDGDHAYGSPLRKVAALNNVDKLDLLVVLTEGLRKDFVKEFNTNNIGVVPNFLDNYEKPSNDNIQKDFNKISIFARLSSEKNISDAIKAFKIVVGKRKESYLNIYGRALKPYEKNEEKRLRSLVEELNLEDHVIFRGHVDNVDEEMASSLATMLVSDIEGMPMVLLESMRNATPLICYNFNYGPSDFVIDGVTGRLVKHYDVEGLANTILDVFNNPNKAIEMGKNAQDKILNDLNEEKLFLRWEKILKDLYINSVKLGDDEIYRFDDEIKFEFDKLNKKVSTIIRENYKLNIQNKRLFDQNFLYKKNIIYLKNQLNKIDSKRGNNHFNFLRKFKKN